ncbi:MAG: DNA starvation/stationary phase protection protein [Euzebyales bacterium]|nr:DNA starvation/stationary phase protection protein [Euzebyales bacterium]
MAHTYTVPGMDSEDAKKVVETLQDRLNALTDLHLTLKHIHWNVVGPNFISVHEMLDPQVDAVRLMSDDVAERIATLGGVPMGTPGNLVAERGWDDYAIGRATTQEHMAALDLVFAGVNASHREAVEAFDDLDLVSQDMLISQLDKLELYQWFVRAHLENASGQIPEASTEVGAAQHQA